MQTLTLNPRQLRSLAAVAPGTLLLTNDSMAKTTFLTTAEDSDRSGVWAIIVYQSGDVDLCLTARAATGRSPMKFLTYDTIQEQTRGSLLEAAAERYVAFSDPDDGSDVRAA